MRAPWLFPLIAACTATPSATPPLESAPVAEMPDPDPPRPMPEQPEREPTHVLQPRQPVELPDGSTLAVDDVMIETIEPSPDGSYPDGGGIEVSLVLSRNGRSVRGSLFDVSEGYTPRWVTWLEDVRIEMVSVENPYGAPKVAVIVETVGESRTGAPAQRVKLRREQPVMLDDGRELTFVGHSHKSVEAGQDSPLIVTLRWRLPGDLPVEETENLSTSSGEVSWRHRDLELTLLDWDYDAWMELEIHPLQRLRVAP